MLKDGIIRKSESSFASPVVVVKKKDQSSRVCVDYRKLNQLTITDPVPMTSSEDLLQALSTAKYFSKLDLTKGFWQIGMHEEDIHKTAFVTPDGHYEFLKMPFGLVNASATLVRNIRELLGDIENVDTYIDDIIVYTEDWETHVQTLKRVFKRLEEANLTVKPTKCTLGETTIDFIGHAISDGYVTPNTENIAKIRDAQPPKTKKQVQSFLGLTGFYRDFIPGYADIAAPLTNLVKKQTPKNFILEQEAEESFAKLKAALCGQPILKIPNHAKPFTLRTDASSIALGAMLMQEEKG